MMQHKREIQKPSPLGPLQLSCSAHHVTCWLPGSEIWQNLPEISDRSFSSVLLIRDWQKASDYSLINNQINTHSIKRLSQILVKIVQRTFNLKTDYLNGFFNTKTIYLWIYVFPLSTFSPPVHNAKREYNRIFICLFIYLFIFIKHIYSNFRYNFIFVY